MRAQVSEANYLNYLLHIYSRTSLDNLLYIEPIKYDLLIP